jgi:hypothetical protein
MDIEGGVFSQDRIFATLLPEDSDEFYISVYDDEELQNVYTDAPENGFSVIILPSSSDSHSSFSLNSPRYPEFAMSPLIGWISGSKLEDGSLPKVYDGRTRQAYDDAAVVMHVSLPENRIADIDIVNIFEPGDGDILHFPVDGFFAKDVIVNGKRVNFAEYLRENQSDIKLPLVADIYGSRINTSFRKIEGDLVYFYAPVYSDTGYKLAKPLHNYVQEFNHKIPAGLADKTYFSCNCILNYQYAELEGKRTVGFTGPVTFGEVAYQLMNQTMAYITIEEA